VFEKIIPHAPRGQDRRDSASALFALAFILLIFFLCYAHRAPRQELLDQFDPWIDDLDRAVRKEAESRPDRPALGEAARSETVTALALALTIGLGGASGRASRW
jgi:hypothetical protein